MVLIRGKVVVVVIASIKNIILYLVNKYLYICLPLIVRTSYRIWKFKINI